MTKFGKKKKAISPIIATLILIVITVIAGIALYGFVSGYMSTITPTSSAPPSYEFITEQYTPYVNISVSIPNPKPPPPTITKTITVKYNSFNFTIQNTGSTPITITKAYLINASNNQLYSVVSLMPTSGETPLSSVTIAPNQIMVLNVSTLSTTTPPPGSYYVKFITSTSYSIISPTVYAST